MFDNFLIHTFHDGNCLQAYKIFGAHFETYEGKKGVRFTTYAPNAKSAQVIGVKHLVIWKNIITEEFIPFL